MASEPKKGKEPPRECALIKAALKSWFGLTPREQGAVLLVLCLALIGLAVRCWHHAQNP